MAWSVKNNNLTMVEGDWGIALPVSVDGVEFAANDMLRFTFKDANNGNELLMKEYAPVDGTVNLIFSEAESAIFPVGSYVYSLDWYHEGSFLCNVTPTAALKVVDKA